MADTGAQRLLFTEDLVSTGSVSGDPRYGVVGLIHGDMSSGDSSETDDEENKAKPLKRGYVRVQWYPLGSRQDAKECKLKLVDRSLMPRDIVRRGGNQLEAQSGTVLDVKVYCTVVLLGSGEMIYPVNTRDLTYFTPYAYGDYVEMDCWLGRVLDVKSQLIIRLSNGARCAMSVDDACKLQDLNPHPSDSGVFFSEHSGFYPSQLLIGPSKSFANVQWLSGVKPVIRKKSNFKALVEKVEVATMEVRWITMGYSSGKAFPSIDPPSAIVTQELLPRIQRLNFYDHARMMMGERVMYNISPSAKISHGKPDKDFFDWNPPLNENVGDDKSEELHVVWMSPSNSTSRLAGDLAAADDVNGEGKESTVEKNDQNSEDIADEQRGAVGEHRVALGGRSLVWENHTLSISSDSVTISCTRFCHSFSVDHFVEQPGGRALLAYLRGKEEEDEQLPALLQSFVKEYLKSRVAGDENHIVVREAARSDGAVVNDDGKRQGESDGMFKPVSGTKRAKVSLPGRTSEPEDGEADWTDESDETSSVSSMSSTASSQGGPPSRRKQPLPLNVKKLKKKMKQKRKPKVTREIRCGDRLAVEVVHTKTYADVMWQNGQVEVNIRSNDLIPVQHMDENEFWPGTFVMDKRESSINSEHKEVYGVVKSADHRGRTCCIAWYTLDEDGFGLKAPRLLHQEDDVSVYDISDHTDFQFQISDTVIRLSKTEMIIPTTEEPCIGQVVNMDESGKVKVRWINNSISSLYPQELFKVSSDFEDSDLDSVEEECEEDWSDDYDSWETDDDGTEMENQAPASAVEDEAGDGPADASPPSPAADKRPKPQQHLSEAEADGSKGASGGRAGAKNPEASAREPAGAESGATASALNRASRDLPEIKEATVRLLESLKNMTVEQVLVGSPTTAAQPCPERPSRDHKFLNDIKKLQELLRKTMDSMMYAEDDDEETEKPSNEKEEAAVFNPSKTASDAPVLCERSGAKPGVILTSAQGEVFSVLETAPDSHMFKKTEFLPSDPKKFFSSVRKEMALLATSLPEGIVVKTFEDRMDLFSALIHGPARTPYEDGLFVFDIQLPAIYPACPPSFHYLSQCSGRLNPNLYENGKVCVSLLGTWVGKGTEKWTNKSSLLQVLISIQGLILVNEPYYNEAGFESDRGLQEGYENSRCYNEMALIKLVQSMTLLLNHPPAVFQHEIREHFQARGWRMLHRLQAWLDLHQLLQQQQQESLAASPPSTEACAAPPTLGQGASSHGGSRSDNFQATNAQVAEDDCAMECGDSAGEGAAAVGGAVGGGGGDADDGAAGAVFGGEPTGERARAEGKALDKSGEEAESAVKPKKRKKSYRTFLQGKSGYPDVGFPLFPLSKGFSKSLKTCLQQYQSILMSLGIPDNIVGRPESSAARTDAQRETEPAPEHNQHDSCRH
uniref:(E3-independent) E2 ubiquitin-conjugating enzyme n=1 Tax=Petromyzon marinus TaxID=7757 RepID=A0AAJ7X658_PETMA|nr:(E3-independent) E2 ubiquitin-conjugating enzyme [Petromyzon marinus]